MHEYVCTYSSHFICSTHIYNWHNSISRARKHCMTWCEFMVGICTVLGVRWSVMGTRLWINTVYGVD